MHSAEYLEVFREHAFALADTAEQVGLATPVPTCPDWRVRDLVGHVGAVHRWATAYLQAGPDARRLPFPVPPADGLIDWYRAGAATLDEVLVGAPDDLQAWTLFAAPTAKIFWSRRQAHETAIHHADAESAAGRSPSYPTGFALDGIDELLRGFLARPRSTLFADPTRRLLIAPTDADAWWHLTIDSVGRNTRSSGDQDADAVVRGSASDLYLYLWNREPRDVVDVEGDQQVLELWRERARI